MKLFKQLTILCFLVALTSCAREATVFERVKQDEVKLLSFGFYEADNPGMIVKDYVVNDIKSKDVIIALPEEVDKTGLIARFTLSNQNVARVGAVIQKSGETVNDFSIPVDYVLSVGNNNSRYTIRIDKAPAFIWKPVPFTYNDSAVGIKMKISPATKEPYIMYYESRPSSSDQGVSMIAFQNGVWNSLGRISDGRSTSFIDFTFNNAGIPYASYVDYTAAVAQAATVKKYDNGTAWSLVGAKGVTTTKITYNTLTFNTDSKLLMVTMMDAANVLARREAGVSIFENNAWSTDNKVTGRASSLFSWFLTTVTKNGVTYLGIVDAAAPGSFSLYKFENNAWSKLVEQWRDPKATQMHTSGDFDMDVDNEGNVYAALADNSSTAAFQHRVVKYDAATKTVSSIGSSIAGASGGSFSFDLALSPLGTPYLFYRSSTNYPTLVYLDKDTHDWSTPYVFETDAAAELNLDFTSDGEAYVAYLKGRKLFVHKYTAP